MGEQKDGVCNYFFEDRVTFPKVSTSDNPESLTISFDSLAEKITIVNLYHRPGDSKVERPLPPNTYSSFFEKGWTIVMGDFNAHTTLFGSTVHHYRP